MSTLPTHFVFNNAPARFSFEGPWNANTNTPALVSSVGTLGHLYEVSVAGTTTLNGESDWPVGAHLFFNGTTWEKVVVPIAAGGTGGTSAGVASVNLGHQQVVSGSGSINLDWTIGDTAVVNTATGNITFTFTDPPNYGTLLKVLFVQDGGGGHTATWPGSVSFLTGSSGTPESGGGEGTVFFLMFVNLGVDVYVAWQVP